MYKLTVTAYDCGKNRASEDVLVKINIKPICKPSWQGTKDLWIFCLSYIQTNTAELFCCLKLEKLSVLWNFSVLEQIQAIYSFVLQQALKEV